MENFNQYNQGYNQGYPNQEVYNNQVYQQQTYQNNPTQGYQRATPVKGWSWGAFMFNITWGLGNKVYWPFLSLLALIPIPIVNILVLIGVAILNGIKGHEWAMKSGTFNTVEEYNAAQKTWDRAGKIMFFVTLILSVGGILISLIFGAALVAAIAGAFSGLGI